VLEKLILLFGQGANLALLGPFSVLILCGLGLPIPEDIVLVTAGFLGAQDSIPFLGTALVMYLGILGGDSVVFAIGRYGGTRFVHSRLGRKIMSPEKLEGARKAFAKWGSAVIFVGRFMPGLRAPIYFSAGTFRYSYLRFLLIDGLAALVSAPFFVWLGHKAFFIFGTDFDAITAKISKYQTAVIAGALVLAVIIALVIWLRSRNRKNSDVSAV